MVARIRSIAETEWGGSGQMLFAIVTKLAFGSRMPLLKTPLAAADSNWESAHPPSRVTIPA